MLHLERSLRGLPPQHQVYSRRHRAQFQLSTARHRDSDKQRFSIKRRRLQSTEKEQAETEGSLESQLEKLKTSLKEAIVEENYKCAASLRDQIQELEVSDPVRALKAQLESAVNAEDFSEAIRCRDALEKLRPKPKPRIPATPPPPTKSDTITNGIRIQVKSSFLPHRSRPGQYVFMYQVKIKNQMADTTVKLWGRHWIVEDANGFTEDIRGGDFWLGGRGEGVLGEQPEIAPETEYEYSSAVPMRTPTGKMKGSYSMQVKDSQGNWMSAFDATVGVFGLNMSDSSPL